MNKLLDVDVTIAVGVQQGEDDLRLVRIDVQPAEVRFDNWVGHVGLEFGICQSPRRILVCFLEESFDGLRHGLHLIQIALNDLILCPRANGGVYENSRNHVEKSHHTEGNIEIEEDEIKFAHADFFQNCGILHPIISAAHGTPQCHHRDIEATIKFVDVSGRTHCDAIAPVDRIEMSRNCILKYQTKDEDYQEHHLQCPKEVGERVEHRKDHGSKLSQSLNRPHEAYDTNQPENAQNPQKC
mmetsp:Transcript_82967/g.131247  ORF Transcript_82967/g.131247 Transcript_82967/m.131247 type:complete len:241 (-) Transcript_82967:478-1200(-)